MGISSGCPSRRRHVAGIALTAIVHVIGRFVLSVVDQIRCCITVAGRAITCGSRRVGRRVIHRTWHEGNEAVVVASVALRPGRDVRYRLGQGIHRCKTTAVTSRALSRSPRVTHCCRLEGSEVAMTGVALRRCRNVRIGLGVRLRNCPVVTGRTSPRRTGSMDKCRPCPGHIAAGMAGIALGIRRNVVRCLAKGVGIQEVAAVTARAVTRSNRPGGSGMAHRYVRTETRKGAVAVTGIALRRRRNMRRWLAKHRCAVVAS